jgi:hypothetical protein
MAAAPAERVCMNFLLEFLIDIFIAFFYKIKKEQAAKKAARSTLKARRAVSLTLIKGKQTGFWHQ